ncbi:MAG TPA: bifunctional precorrin-2 dehydrogenase/sirohydrochlorin ferrochelatase [Dehalococcoidia bacterium]|nr:bifunctional precorrin-2 dehydrogenase/sirohydrochlorin ferrochelatase [Dehalococcoidia bacterium]
MKRRAQMPPHYPIFLNIQGKRCLVVGGGQVAWRKARTLLEHGARVKVVSPELGPELSELARSKAIQVAHRHYEPRDLRGVFLAIAATDDANINRKVAEEARGRRVLTNVADDPEGSDFIVPSYLRRGDVAIAISTGGRSPALARKIRTKLEAQFGAEYASLALLLDQVRSELKGRGVMVDGDTWQEALDLEPLLALLRAGRSEEAKARLLEHLDTTSRPRRG